MRQATKEEEMPISPGPNSSVPEIFSSKKIFFLNSSCSGSRRSEIPHIESDYCRRDEVSRRLFHHNSDLCDCDCASDGCGGCIRRNKQCFFKFFVLGLSIALILLLFGSLSYNLTRNKTGDESLDFEEKQWVSHHHEYSVAEEKHVEEKIPTSAEIEPVLNLPVPLYKHPEDYDSDEDLRRLQYHLDVRPDRGHEHIEPISVPPLSDHNINPESGVLIIYDGREPSRVKRSISSRSKTKDLTGKHKSLEKLGKPKRDAESESYEFLFEKLNRVEEGMEKFWESYFKKGKTVFEPFSLTTPSHSTPMQSEESSEEEEIEDELKNMFLNEAAPENFNPVTSKKISLSIDQVTVGPTETTTVLENEEIPKGNTLDTQTAAQTTEIFTPGNNIEDSTFTETVSAFDSEFTSDESSIAPESSTLDETSATDAATEKEASTQEAIGFRNEDLRMDSMDGRDFPTWPLFNFPLPFSGLFGTRPQDPIAAESAPLDTVRGISLADAKKLKKEKRKHLLLNSRVVGGSSDVRLPTGPDVSKPFVNAFETLKTNQQLSFTPSAASQFVLPYQMCLFAGPFQGFKPSAHGPQPRTFSFGTPPLLPSIFDKAPQPPKNPYQMPAQQNFLSFSINNYPNAPPRQQVQPSGGSFFNFPNQQTFSQFPSPNKQPIFCTYLQPPLFQFPTVPGTADFSHAKCVDCQGESQKDVAFAKEIAFPSGRETICSDEKVSCLDGSSCIPVGYWCDNQVHCKDASDEAFCSCRERVSKERLCDGYIDCPHGEDETACFDCPKSAFSCGSFISPNSCIPLSKRCDGVRDCPTGADETDCSALFFHVRQNDSYLVPQVTGYLHHNWKGDWFPVCVEMGENIWAEEACSGELVAMSSNMEVKFAPVSSHYKGPFIVREEDGTVALQDHCKGHVSTYITCPPMNCGTRLEFYNTRNSFLQDERKKAAGVKRNSPPEKSAEKSNQEAENLRLRREETGRVVGGRESEPKAWPWAIAVYKNGAFHCGGVILDEKWVLTAAHCMEQYWKHYYEVRGGMLRRFSFSAMEQPRTVSHVIIHENYDLAIMSNDLALLRLQEPFHFNRWVRPACLPVLQAGVSKFVSGPAPGTRCTAVGWGALKERGADPDQLREVEIPIMSRCKHKEDLVGEEICAGKLEGGKDTCQGDSGGPLLCRDSSNPAYWYVAGIVSHGEGCARPGEPGAYTRISLFVDWITANTNDFQLPTDKPLQNCPGFRCRSASKLCIPRKWVCNGFTDCLEAEDEKNCSSSVASSIFNGKYTAKDKYFGEGEVESEKFERIPKILDSQPLVKGDNWQRQQNTERTEGLEFATETALTPSGGITADRTTERLFRPENANRHHIEGLKSVELEGGTIAHTNPTENFSVRTTEGLFSPENVERHSTEGLSTSAVTNGHAKSVKKFTEENGERITKESSWKNEEVLVTTEGLITRSEIQRSKFFEGVTEAMINSKTEEDVKIGTKKIFEETGKEYLEEDVTQYGTGKTSIESTWKSGEDEVATEVFTAQTEQESTFYERVIDKTETEKTEEEDEGTESVGFGNKNAENDQRDWKVKEEEKLPTDEKITTEGVMPRTEEQETKYEEVTDRIIDEKREEDVNTENVDKKVTKDGEDEKVTTARVVAQIEKQESESYEEFTEKNEAKNAKNFEDMGATMSKGNFRSAEGEKITTEGFVTMSEKQETSYEGVNERVGDETLIEKESEKYLEESEVTESKYGVERTSAENNWKDEEDETVTKGVTVETEKNEEVTTESIVTGMEDLKSNIYKYPRLGEAQTEVDDESEEDSKEGKANEEEHTLRNNFESTKEDETGYENEAAKAEDEKSREVVEETYTQETLLTNLITTEFEEEKIATEFSTERLEKKSGAEETQLTERIKATKTQDIRTEAEETTQMHSIRTRETPETEIKFEEYSTSSSGFMTTFQSSDSTNNRLSFNPDYFQCQKIVQSILPTYQCDGHVDCEDGTDEENCTCLQVLQNSNPEYLCDGRAHCPDSSDEKNCSKCRENEFYCKYSKECLSLVERCDGMSDCTFGEDEAKCLSLGETSDRFLTEGLMMVNRNGVRKVWCQEDATPLGAGDAIKVCSTLGTIGYERYENRSLSSNCTGFYVTCAKSLSRSVETYKVKNGSYMWPWNGLVYSDGKLVCSGVLLRPRWLLTSSQCLLNVSLSKNYLIAKFSDETTTRIDGAQLIPESNAVLLHLSVEINQTESVRPLGVPYIFESDPEKDVCVAVSDQTVFLKILKHCRRNTRCYKKITPTPSSCRSKPWTGVIVCQSRFGWYPSSAFSEKLGYCGFKQVNFTSLQENLREVMDKKVEVFPEPFCNGFRCPQGFCISHNKTCDGKPDCSGKEDESFGLCASKKQIKECKITELKCRNGGCIPKVLFGDGIKDCEDGSDEPSNITCFEYLRLTAPERICDGKRNCYDKTDENYRLCSCDGFKFQCKLSGNCIPKDFVCDGENDCPGGEDEEQCLGRKIVKNHTKTHLEVLRKSFGIWHTMCPSNMSKERSDAFCRDLGFKEALFTYSRNQTVILPQTDPFSWVKLNQKTSIGLRGNKPFVRLVTFKKTCDSVKCA